MTPPQFPLLAMVAALVLVLLAGAVIHADMTRRQIPNGLCMAIAISALFHDFAQGGWSATAELASRALLVSAIALPLVALFALRAIGGGDVKLLVAVLLWIPASQMPTMFIVTVAVGAMIALALKGLGRVFCFVRSDTVPYGLAIVTGALWVLLPMFGTLAGHCLA